MHTLCTLCSFRLSVDRSGSLLHATFHSHMQNPIPSKAPPFPSGTTIPSPRTHLLQQHTNTSPRGPHHFFTPIPFSQNPNPQRSRLVSENRTGTRVNSDRPLISQFRTPSRRRGAGARHAFCVHGMGPPLNCMWRKLPYVSIHESVWTYTACCVFRITNRIP